MPQKLVRLLLDWFAQNARDLPWRQTCDPYAIWVSEIMLQQTQVKTVLPFWERWMRELPTIESLAHASSDKIHKLWEGLGYYTRVRNMQKAAQQIVADSRRRGDESQIKSSRKKRSKKNRQNENQLEILQVGSCKFPNKFDEVLALPGIGRYTAGAICSIAFNQPTPLLDGNVMRVLTRIFGIEKDPREKSTNEALWDLADELVHLTKNRSHLNQSLMELGALVCTPRNPHCLLCPANQLCVAFKENRTGALPNLGKREPATARRFVAFLMEHEGKFLVRRRPENVVNAHLWEFPNVEANGWAVRPEDIFRAHFGFAAPRLQPLPAVKHSITRYRITLEAFRVPLKKMAGEGTWLAQSQLDSLAFAGAHRRILSRLQKELTCLHSLPIVPA